MGAKNTVAVDFLSPPGDPGLFGPDSACWQVHSDFTSMLIGGVSALLLQALHPLALAGVWDYSNFREDMLGRLRRTAQFIGGTTFGSRHDAEQLISRVKRIHAAISGVAPDGRPYAADDPDLLTWVHVAEVRSFLTAHLRYKNPRLSLQLQDQYYAEYARIAKALGAKNVPSSCCEVEGYLERKRGELCCDERTREVVRLVLCAPAPGPAAQAWTQLMMRAGVDLLPDWALELLGLRRHGVLIRGGMRVAVIAAAKPLRWAVRNGSVQLAKRRVAVRTS